MRLAATYLTIVLVGVALGRNIDTDQAKGTDAVSQFSEEKTLENSPVQYRRNQMRQKLSNNEKPTYTATDLKPAKTAVKGEDVIPSADAIKKDTVRQPALVAQLIQKEDAAKVKVPEIKKDKDVKESNRVKQLQSGNDKIKAMLKPKEPLTALNSKNNVKGAAEDKTNEIIKEIKDIPAIAKPLQPRTAIEKDNLVAKAVELNGDSVEALADSKEKLSKDKKKTETESSKTSEEKNNADENPAKTTSEEGHEKETKKKLKSSDEKGASKITDDDLNKHPLKISEKADQLKKSEDSHKRKDKNDEKKKKYDDSDDDEDSSDEDDD